MTFSILTLFCSPDMGAYDIMRLLDAEIVRTSYTESADYFGWVLIFQRFTGPDFLFFFLFFFIFFIFFFLNLDDWASILRVDSTAGKGGKRQRVTPLFLL